MTKKEQLRIRDETYEDAVVDACCFTCRHSFSRPYSETVSLRCEAIEIRGCQKLKTVNPLGLCDLWEHKK